MAQADYDPEHDLLLHTCKWTPEERMQWLEEALDFALETGALEKTRRLEVQREDFMHGSAPTAGKM